ncbi:hypothetical protein [Dyella ginsengisoli]|uniref:hypothetical protein n=1 Tax=Dyella ginsengisoli TaxID=363848 RepID=UPI0012FD6A90|nr:hypothetical protein [Dyella ginsengisoli]
MSSKSSKFGWEWRADRDLDQRAAVRLVSIKAESGGLLGIGRSPSLSGSLPDAQKVDAEVLAISAQGPMSRDEQIVFRIPKLELHGATIGNVVEIGVIGSNVVCLRQIPGDVQDASLDTWLAGAPCP